jgi:hypothetical protein
LGIEVDFSLPAERVIRSLSQIIELRSKPLVIRVDNVLGHKEARCCGKQVSMREFAPAG